ncbi:MAG: GDP-mannose 4,6-dehydratase [Chloroflexi bacterium]|nr:GDP-mannose 4,6-dehydratase [Chloroflexota bacterium]
MRVLLTGIAGFIGSHVVEHLQANTDWEIIGLASFRHRGDSERTESFDPDRVTIHYADLRGDLSPTLVSRIGPVDYILNLAAESHVDRSITEPRPFIENNVSAAITMLEYARIAKPRAFIQVSTDEVYGPAAPGQYHAEWEPIIPSNPYSASKVAQEAIATSYWRTFGVPVVITNNMNVIGERQDTEKIVPKAIRSIITGEPVPIHADASGNPGSRFYLHARNIADAWLWLLTNTAPEMYPHVGRPSRWNIVGEEELDNLTLVRMIGDVLGTEPKVELVDFHNARPGHDRRYALDGRKIHEAGWRPPVNLRDSLAKTVWWSVANPEWLGLTDADVRHLR